MQHLLELEQELLEEETPLPVYFTYETDELNAIYDNIANLASSSNAGSAFEGALLLVLLTI